MAEITIPPSVRGGPGSSMVMTPGLRIPARLTSIGITYSIPQADRDSTSSLIHQMIEVSADEGATWQNIMDGGVWRGGTGYIDKRTGELNPAPAMTIAGPSMDALDGMLTRGSWRIPVSITIGATVRTG